MSINSNNIDQWLFDYYEGNLSPDDVRKLEQYLKKNPEYYEDAEAWKDAYVEESVPAFSTAFLVKEPEPKSDRRKIAYAALLLLLLTSAATIYYLLPSATPSKGHLSSSVHNQFKQQATTPNNYQDAGNRENNTNVIHANNSTSNKEKTAAGLSFTPEISKLEEMVTAYNNNNVSNQSNQIIINQYYTNGNNITVERQSSRVVASNFNTTNHTSFNTTNTLPANNNPNHIANTAELTMTGNQQPVLDPHVNDGIAVNNQVQNNNNVVSNEQVEQNTQQFQADPASVLTEDINLTLENTPENKEAVKENNTEKQEKQTAVQENKDNKTLAQENRTSDLNPDVLLANAKKEDQNKSVDIEKEKTKIPTDVKGIGFTNRKQVTLLQNINSEFENNAAFITQHYATDAYMGVHLNQASPFESGAGQMLGMSQYFRKAKTTINAYGFNDKMGYLQQTGLNLQMATQFRLDRYQSIIPSVSLSTTRYQFQQVNIKTDSPSYSAGLLTGSQTYNNYQNATKFNLSAGMLYHHKKFFAGLSMNGLLQPKFKYQGYDRTNTVTDYATVTMMAGTDFISKNRPELSLSPQMMITVRNMEAEVSGGAVLRYKSWGIGAGIGSSGAVNTYAGYSNRTFSVQYRYMYDKLDAPFRGITGHYLTTHFNLKSFVRKQKPILDSEK